MNILILNWRDIKNPAGGGAELLTHEIAKRWSGSGNTVSQFSAHFKGAKKKETIDGVQFIRKGKWWNVHIYAFFYYFKHRNNFDVIIDEVHWFPFFSYLYAPRKTVALTCEVATKLFFRIFPVPIAYCFQLVEKVYLLLYRNVPTMVISSSTKDDLIAAGYNKNNIFVLPMGITIPNKIVKSSKEKVFTLISVGRLNKQKGTLDLIDAFNMINKSIPESTLWLVGVGDEVFTKTVTDKIKELGLEKNIKLWGFVTEQKKFELLSKAHLLVSASAQEGWGLTIPEAGYVKTPSVVYDIQGFRDIIVNNKNGILTKTDFQSLATAVINLHKNKNKYKSLQENINSYAQKSTWDTTADMAMKYMRSSLFKH